MNEVIENRKKSEILAESINALNYGDFISHKQIAALIDEKYPSSKYSSTIAKEKKILLKQYNKVLESIIGDGYRVIQPDDFVQQSLKHYKRGFTEMKKGYDTLEHAPTKDMTPEGLDAYRRVYDRAVILQASMNGVKVELKTLSKKSNHPFAPENIRHN